MKIFVAGATGVLGRRAVKLLVGAGHDVSAVARSDDKAALLARLGATGARVDLFDSDAVEMVVAGHDVVVNLATHIPSSARIMVVRAWRQNDRIRREVSRNLVDAALHTGAVRYVQESIGFLYADGGARWIDEDDPFDLPPHARTVADAEAHVARFTADGGVGVALRFGLFYCADSPQSRLQVRLARWGISSSVGNGNGYQSIIHVDDAASAVLAALDLPAGAYNVVDDEPLTKREATATLARSVGRKKLFAPPAVGAVARALARSQRISNRCFREASSWRPAYPSAREGLPALVADVLGRTRV